MKKFSLPLICAVVMAIHAIAGGSAHANLLVNGGFELPVGVVPANDGAGQNFVSYATPVDMAHYNTLPAASMVGWTVLSGSVDIVSNLTGAFYGWPAFEPVNSLDLNGWSMGSISQSFATVAGTEYNLTFVYANNPYGTTVAGGPTATVTIDGATTALAHNTSTVANMDWKLFAVTFTASSALTTLSFASTSGGTGGIALDAIDVSLTHPNVVTPEPTSFALLGMGVFGAAVGAYRRRRSVA